MELERAQNVVGALKLEGIPAQTEYTGGGIFLAEVDLGDGTILQIGEDDRGFGWAHCDRETGELVGESPTTRGDQGELGVRDLGKAAEEIRRLIQGRGWTATEVR